MAASSFAEVPSAVVYGCAGPVLTDAERAFFADARPLGFILFRRNCVEPSQVRALVADLRAAVGWQAPVLIDQEGGRVARLQPPHWPKLPAARRLGDLAARDPEAAREAARTHGRLLAALLSDLGIDVDCAPVADVPVAGAHDVIGDRAFGTDPTLVATLARAQAEGLLEGGVLPVVKHVPGHGRAGADSHQELPVVTVPLAALRGQDFAPFRDLADMPLAMAAHVVYTALDPGAPASTSAAVIAEVVRGWIGFDGLLLSDDLSMQALSGTLPERALAVLAAGCDAALHCNGDFAEMQAIAARAPALSAAGQRRWRAAKARVAASPPAEIARLQRQLDGLVG